MMAPITLMCSAELARRLWPPSVRSYDRSRLYEGVMLVASFAEPTFCVPLDPELRKRGGPRG